VISILRNLKQSPTFRKSWIYTLLDSYRQNEIITDNSLNIGRATSILIARSPWKIGSRSDFRLKINVGREGQVCEQNPNTGRGPLVFESSYRGRPKGGSYNQALIAEPDPRK
jgi:hypothetical protein